MKNTKLKLGLGVGWRPELARAIERRDDIGFVEVVAENLDPAGEIPNAIRDLQARGIAVVPHGVSLSIGGAEPIDDSRIARLRDLATRLNSPLVSEHIAFVRAGNAEAGHLLPVPRTPAAVDVVTANTRRLMRRLDVPFALENISAVFDWPDAQMTDGQFLHQVLDRTGAMMLLDVANLWCNWRNLGSDPRAVLDELPLDRIAYVHMGGGVERDGVYHDTHAHPVPAGALELLEELCSRVDIPGVMLERDDDFPTEGEFHAEIDAIKSAVAKGTSRRLADEKRASANLAEVKLA